MKKVFLFLVLALFSTSFILAQDVAGHKSIHQLDLETYGSLNFKTDAEWDAYNGYKKMPRQSSPKTGQLNKIVFGWHPSWVGSAYNNYQWDKLSDLAYFSYEVDYTDGSAVSSHSFSSANVVDVAKSNGVRVHLTVTLFSHFDDFFANSSAQTNLINNVVSMVKNRGCQGVNIDFEGMGSDNRAQFATFMHNLKTKMNSEISNNILSVCLYAVDWNGVFDFGSLNNDVDIYAIMGYDYYYKGSDKAGPTSQQYTMDNFAYTQMRSISYYTYKGAPKDKLILGVPYYGYDWKTASTSVPSSTTATGTSRTYKVIKANTSGYYSNPQIEPHSLATYFVYSASGVTHQCWTDDENTLENHYKLVHQTGIAGIGIWALGYDDGYNALWDLLGKYFTDSYAQPATETIWDLGGPLRNYNNHEDYTYTIQPAGATGLTLDFSQFDVEANYDYLYIYDGTSTTAPLIGKYTGTNSPGTITASGNALTIRFTSDGATTKPGWTATWNATTTTTAPTTQVTAGDWQKSDFTATYTDNTPSGSITDKFYQILDNNGSEWRANGAYGFLNDNFNTSINAEWTQQSGNWVMSAGTLKQTDDGNSNTNMFISATQGSSNSYLYSWKMKLSGTAGNRRGGIHFFCDDATLSNRGNNYMVYYRADNNKVQIYEYTNNSMNLKTDDVVTINPDQWYNCKVTYNPSTGEIKAFLDGNLVSSWTDATPITSGSTVSLRSGNAVAYFDDFQMFKSRNGTTNITVGTGKEVRYQNANPSSPSCRINSIILNDNNKFSTVGYKDVNIDWTNPAQVATVNDGTGADIDETSPTSELSGNWTASSDANSGIVKYWYSISTTAGGNNIKDWTDVGTATTATATGLSLSTNTTYYFNVKAENIAGLYSNVKSSDGIILTQAQSAITAPDWASADFTVSFTDNGGTITDKFYQVIDLSGSEWRANGNYGFLNDNFTSAISSEWTKQVGTWVVSNNTAKQSDDGNSNTNMFISATQGSSNSYLYSWKMKLSGTAGNRRGGIHFFCDDATQSNRGNNYMVYYRADNNKVQIYEYTNNSMSLKTDDACTINADQWYDCKITYNPSTGEIKAFLDGNLVSSWTDATPITSGNSVSLRTGNAIGYFDDFQMFKSRNSTANVTVGTTKEVRYQSPNPSTASCRINSIVLDNNNNFSDLSSADVKIDWSAPSIIATLNDGTSADEDVTSSTTELSANWSASSDANSGIVKYWFSIGTTPTGTDVVNWTDNGTQTSVTKTGLSLTNGTTYYFTLKGENGVGLMSTIKSSDGIKVQTSTPSSGCDNCPDIILY